MTSSWSAARFCVDHLSSDYLFHRSPTAMYLVPEAGTWNSCSGLKKSTQVNCMRKHNNSVYSSSQDSELSPTLKKKKNRHQSHRCQVTHKKEVSHWLFLAFTVCLWSPSLPRPTLMPSGLQLAHFTSATAAKKSTAPACNDKRSVWILVPQYVT